MPWASRPWKIPKTNCTILLLVKFSPSTKGSSVHWPETSENVAGGPELWGRKVLWDQGVDGESGDWLWAQCQPSAKL